MSDEFEWRQVKDTEGQYVHHSLTHAYPTTGWDRDACAAGVHPGCDVKAPRQWHSSDDCPDLGSCEYHAITSAL